MSDAVMVTGGSGFIGTNFILRWLLMESSPVINFDGLTYAGNSGNLVGIKEEGRYTFVHGDTRNAALLREVLFHYQPRAIVHLAAETHVDRSIVDPEAFIQSNVVGTSRLLLAAREYWEKLCGDDRLQFVFLHVSTDEVYGSLGPSEEPFRETSPCAPNSPYSASKAAADHLVRAYHSTYGLPVLVMRPSNNYGPFQIPEKLVPLLILNGSQGLELPIYGDGQQIRDWIYVADHCDAIRMVLAHGRVPELYNVGGGSPKTNLEVATVICDILDELQPRPNGARHISLIKHIKDRPGHDRRYALDTAKIVNETNWRPREAIESGLRKTVVWYLKNSRWAREVLTPQHNEWTKRQYPDTMR
jgi:dTDP-glucose 4,6-dehydratase